jgi:beta-lactamase class A
MSRRSTPGAGQWFTVALIVTATVFLLVKLFQYASLRGHFPTGLTIAGVDVGNMSAEQASEILTNRYIEAPIVIYHGEQQQEISPTEVEFQLNLEAMLSRADFERDQQDFWAGFWGFLWGRPVEVQPVPLSASHNREALREILKVIATHSDQPAQPPQPVPATLSFQYGESGTETNIEASFADVEAALYRPSGREAHLVVEPRQPARPEINLLTRLLVNSLQDFEQATGGVASLFIMDLQTGEEIPVNADVAMSGIDILKVPIILETFRILDQTPTLSQNQLISDTLVVRPDHLSANSLLNVIAGQDDPYAGAAMVTESMRRLGLANTFIVTPYDAEVRAGTRPPETPANTAEGLRTQPDPYKQTTAAEIGTLLSMIYYCAQGHGGTLAAVYGEQLTQTECQTIIAYMSQNNIDSLIEEGVPPEATVAHRHGWISDTHGDAGIVFSPGGDYVIVQLIYKPDWLEWEVSSPLLADISRAAYNYFNFDNPYLSDSRTN